MKYGKFFAIFAAACLTACSADKTDGDPIISTENAVREAEISAAENVSQQYETSAAESTSEPAAQSYANELPDGFTHIEIEPQCGPSMAISFSIPEDWGYEMAQTCDVPTSSTSVYLKPDEASDSVLTVMYTEGGLGVCGTGLIQKPVDFNGHTASQGFYDGHDVWSFISLDREYKGCAVLNNTNLYNEYADMADLILSTVDFRWCE